MAITPKDALVQTGSDGSSNLNVKAIYHLVFF